VGVAAGKLISTGGLPVAEHWKVYLPALLISFVIMVPAIILAERFARMKLIFNAAIVLLLAVQMGFGLFAGGLYGLAFWLTLFFVAFNILEATQPSLISRIAPPHAKGAALGVYNTTQAWACFSAASSAAFWPSMPAPVPSGWRSSVLSFVWLLLGLTMSMPPLRSRPAPVPA
jgi:hypothetical protein